jgi:hypothetical protein
MNSPEDSYLTSVRRLLLLVMFCALMLLAMLEAAYRLPFPIEIRAYGAGMRHGYPIHLLAVFGTHLGKSMLAFRVPLLGGFAVLLVFVLWVVIPTGASVRWLLYATAAVLTVVGLAMVHEVGVLRSQRHALFALRDCLEASAAPDEPIVIDDDSLQKLLEWYISAEQRREMGLPVPSPSTNGEFLYVGSGDADFVQAMTRRGYVFRAGDCVSPETGHVLARLLNGADVRMYFVTHDVSAVSSNP